MSSRQPTYLFFASPKKSRQKVAKRECAHLAKPSYAHAKGDPTEAVGLGPTALRCSVFGASRQTHFVRCAHCVQTNVAKSEDEAR